MNVSYFNSGNDTELASIGADEMNVSLTPLGITLSSFK